jgi:O-antigen/teichoic acid export membrane protein
VNDAASVERAADAPDSTRAGRGFLSITGAKVYFLIAGYAVQVYLPRLLGSPEAYGLFSSALAFVSIFNNVLVNATIQVVSKKVSEAPARADAVLRQSLELQLLIGSAIAGTLLASASLIGAELLLDPKLIPLLRVAALIVLAYALYAAPIGYLNGRQNFRGQARFDMAYQTLRTAGMLGAAAFGLGALGVFWGFASAAVIVLLAALAIVGWGAAGERTPWASWIAFVAPLFLYQLCSNLMLQVDTALLKGTVAAMLQSSGSAAGVAADTASRYVGIYRAAQTIAFVPYQLLTAVAFVLFPMIAHAVQLGDEDAARRYIRAALRFSLLMLLLVAAPVAGASAGAMRVVFPADYVAGASALSVLALAMTCFALFSIAATIMSGAGRPSLAASVGIVAVALLVASNVGLVRWVGVGEHTLLAAASGTALGTALALLAMGTAVYRRFGAFIAPSSALRALLAAALGFAVARVVPSDGKLLALGALSAGAIAYAVALIALRELTRADLDAVLAIVARRRR